MCLYKLALRYLPHSFSKRLTEPQSWLYVHTDLFSGVMDILYNQEGRLYTLQECTVPNDIRNHSLYVALLTLLVFLVITRSV